MNGRAFLDAAFERQLKATDAPVFLLYFILYGAPGEIAEIRSLAHTRGGDYSALANYDLQIIPDPDGFGLVTNGDIPGFTLIRDDE